MAQINVSQDFISIAVGGFIFGSRKSGNDIKIASYITKPKIAEKECQFSGSTEVLASCIQRTENMLAVCNSSKHLLLFDMNTFDLLKTISLEKQATSLAFCNHSTKILVADRAGFVIEFDTKSNEQNSSVILGHVSMLFDLLISSDDKFVVSCDRDEKIRVSKYPNSYHIENYCLGHKQYVRSLCWINFFQDSFLASGGGDGLIIIWDFIQGILLNSFDCSQFTKCPVKKLIPMEFQSANFLITIFEQSSMILCLKLVRETFESVKFIKHTSFEIESEIFDIDILEENYVLILCDSETNPLQSFKINEELNFAKMDLKIVQTFNCRNEFLTAFSNLNNNSQKIVLDIAKERVERKKIRVEDTSKTIV